MQLIARLSTIKQLNRISIFLFLVTLAVVVNIGQFSYIDKNVPIVWEAVHKREQSPFRVSNSTHKRYGKFVALQEMSSDVTLIVPPHKPPSPARLPSFRQKIYGLGKINGMQKRKYDSTKFMHDFEFTKHAIVEDDSYIIAANRQGKPIEKMVLLLRNQQYMPFEKGAGEKIMVFVDIRIIPEKYLKDLEQ